MYSGSELRGELSENLQATETQQLFKIGLLEASVFGFTSLFDSQPVKVFFNSKRFERVILSFKKSKGFECVSHPPPARLIVTASTERS